MGIVMIRCPMTGIAISTGMRIDRAAFRSMPVFFNRSFCPSCGTSHEWFARVKSEDCWIFSPGPHPLRIVF